MGGQVNKTLLLHDEVNKKAWDQRGNKVSCLLVKFSLNKKQRLSNLTGVETGHSMLDIKSM